MRSKYFRLPRHRTPTDRGRQTATRSLDKTLEPLDLSASVAYYSDTTRHPQTGG
jgi:hypothetical protein